MQFFPSSANASVYLKELRKRFGGPSADARDRAEQEADKAAQAADALDRLEAVTPEAIKAPVNAAAQSLRTSAKATKGLIATWDAGSDPMNQAAELVDSALDLQVGKSSGLLAYNGLVVAVSTVLWVSRSLPDVWWYLAHFTLATAVVSSLFSLNSIIGRWPPSEQIGAADKTVLANITLAARRTRSINIAAILAVVATISVGFWLMLSHEKLPLVQIARPIQIATDKPVAISLADTIHLRCVTPPRSSRGGRDLTCTVTH